MSDDDLFRQQIADMASLPLDGGWNDALYAIWKILHPTEEEA